MDMPVLDRVKEWLEQHAKGGFTPRCFREYWKMAVPFTFAPMPNVSVLHTEDVEEQAQRSFFEPLNLFIAGEETPEKVFASIRELDKAPSLCGKVFNNGEPTYGCRDCGFDPTCVLCSDCFKASPHNKHRYKMSTSSGGGYCDCGDTEAWKSGAFCDVHAKGASETMQNLHTKLPPDLVSRLLAVLECIVDYAMEVLTHPEGVMLSTDLDLPQLDATRFPHFQRMADSYSVLLYNDESHTFDQVIYALERSVKCSKKEAVTYVTYIDREGRGIIRTSGLQKCTEVKATMDRIANSQLGKPFIIKGKITRLENIMNKDNELCKATRIKWHKIFISGLLMDFETKKKFARIFTKHYGRMMQAFIMDDHEHSVCIVSLGVQLFTMPTIAHMLIAEEAVLAKLVQFFLVECRPCISNGKLIPVGQGQADVRMFPTAFKRLQFMFFDLKFLLSMVPTQWTDDIRRGFLHGFGEILSLLKCLQNMEPVKRQRGSHVEYEHDWESAFNLHIRLSAIFTQLVDWIVSDRVIMIKAMRMLLRDLATSGMEESSPHHSSQCIEGLKPVTCIEYDVSRLPVSLHVPLTRLCAALLPYLPCHNIRYDSSVFNIKKPSMMELMEPSLRTLVMAAQCKAGMWRRNGMSLSNQIFFYRNVRCRGEMFDKDVLLLQMAGSRLPPDYFLTMLLHKFGLMSWQKDDYEFKGFLTRDEESVEQVAVLAEEFLLLLLYLLIERYTVGVAEVTEDDITKHEVVHLLCIQNMTHSNINKMLPESVNHETGMENVIDEIADFKKIAGDAKGYYELKEKYYNSFNIFFYHYTKEDQSKAEVQHRQRCKALGQEDVCYPPPVPPRFTPAFEPLLDILNSFAFYHIINQVAKRWTLPSPESISETCVQVVLFLIGVALHEEERTPGFIKFPEKLACFLDKIATAKSEPHPVLNSLYKWTSNKMRSVMQHLDQLQEGAAGTSAPVECKIEEAQQSITDTSSAMEEKTRRTNQALERKKRIMEKMASLQQSFMKSHMKEFSEQMEVAPSEDAPALEGIDDSAIEAETMIAVGPEQTLPKSAVKIQTCIVCHQDEQLNYASETGRVNVPVQCDDGENEDEERPLVMGVMVQPSTVLTRSRTEFVTSEQPLYLPADLHRGIHVSSCGHPMHLDCWKLYFSKMIQRGQKRLRSSLNYDLEKNEFPCPLCDTVCNDAVPLIAPPTQPVMTSKVKPAVVDLSPQHWLLGLDVIIKHKTARTRSPPSDPHDNDNNDDPEQPPQLSGDWLPPPLRCVSRELAAVAGSEAVAVKFLEHGLDENPNPKDERILGSVLCSVAYTIRSYEEVQRYGSRSLLAALAERQQLPLAAFLACAACAPSYVTRHQSAAVSTGACVTALADVMGATEKSLLEIDAFSAMVSLVLMMPTLFSTSHAVAKGGQQDHFLLQLCLLGHIVQLLLTYDTKGLSVLSKDEQMDTTESSGHKLLPDDDALMTDTEDTALSSSTECDAVWLVQLLSQCRVAAGLPSLSVQPEELRIYVMENCCPAPEELRSSVYVPDSEYYCLLRYLGLSSSLCRSLQPFMGVVSKWLKHPRLRNCLKDKTFDGHLVLKVNQLTNLKHDYSELIAEASRFSCPYSVVGEKASMPIICLVCGAILCCLSYCCQRELPNLPKQMVGATTYHSHKCGGGSGIFLRIWDCRVVLRTGKFRGCYHNAPYLDQYGETDVCLRRGNPLFLNNEGYARLHQMWLNHLIPEQVCRNLAKQQHSVIHDWQHL